MNRELDRSLGRFLRPPGPLGAGVGYGAALLATTAAIDLLATDGGAAVRAWASTSLRNLTDGPVHAVGALVASAFVTEGTVGWWALLAVIGFTVAGRGLGTGASIALAGGVHLAATGVSQAVVAERIAAGALTEAARAVIDVGPSYVVVAVLAAGIVAAPGRERWLPAAGLAVLAPSLFVGLTSADVAAIGHLASLVLATGAAAAIVLRRRWRSRPARRAGRPEPGVRG